MMKVAFLLLGVAFTVNATGTSTEGPVTTDAGRLPGSGLMTDSLIFKFDLEFYNSNVEEDRIVEVVSFILNELGVDITNITAVTDAGITDGEGILIAQLLLSPDEIEDLLVDLSLSAPIADITTGETTNGVTTETGTGQTFVGTPTTMDKVNVCDDDSTGKKSSKKSSKKSKGVKCKKSKSKKSKKSKSKKSKKSGKGSRTAFFQQKRTQAAFGVSLALIGMGTVVIGTLVGKRYIARRGMQKLEDGKPVEAELETTPLLILE